MLCRSKIGRRRLSVSVDSLTVGENENLDTGRAGAEDEAHVGGTTTFRWILTPPPASEIMFEIATMRM